jgi:serine acetyltransferase
VPVSSLAKCVFQLPLWLILRVSSCRDAAFRDALRRTHFHEPHKVDAGTPWEVMRGLSERQTRSVVYQRLYLTDGWERFASKVLKQLFPGLHDFELNCGDIGPGLVIGHGYGSVLWARRIGSDCFIMQGVTLGEKDGIFPTIGSRVIIYANATIVGSVTVGDDAIVGAGAVVLKDVPPRGIVAGVPARLIGSNAARSK